MVTQKKIQPEINIGLVGHVDHGKTTLVSRLSGKWTDTHSEEVKKGITIRLGYANANIYFCSKCKKHCPQEVCPECKGKCNFVRKVSFIDAPGHETLMATMLSGAAIMDAALLLIAANEECPQPQTREHLMALEIIGIKDIIIIQNKIDLVSEAEARNNYKQIKEFIKGTIAEKAPIIPMSAQHNINVDVLIDQIQTNFKTPKRDLKKTPIMYIARSFDINKPGAEIEKLSGGVIGGVLKQGMFKVGDKIEIKPGFKVEREGKTLWEPIQTEITTLATGNEMVTEVSPGGSIGVSTKLDPSIVKSDSLSGTMAGYPGTLPELHYEIEIEPTLLKRVVGTKKELEVDPLKKGEALMINVNSSVTVGLVTDLHKDKVHLNLKIPICAEKGTRITLSRLLESRFRLIGYGKLI